MIEIKIINVIANGTISAGWDKHKILQNIPSAEYRPNGFPATTVPMQKNTVISLFDSGKVSSKGSKSERYATESILDFVKMLCLHDMKCKVESGPAIVQIVSNVRFGKKIDIARLEQLDEFVRRIEGFASIHLVFSGNVSVLAYDASLVISAGTMDETVHTANMLEQYTIQVET